MPPIRKVFCHHDVLYLVQDFRRAIVTFVGSRRVQHDPENAWFKRPDRLNFLA
jgi:hypothetical protein